MALTSQKEVLTQQRLKPIMMESVENTPDSQKEVLTQQRLKRFRCYLCVGLWHSQKEVLTQQRLKPESHDEYHTKVIKSERSSNTTKIETFVQLHQTLVDMCQKEVLTQQRLKR